MIVDPVFAAWIHTGEPALPGAPAGANEGERFAAYERVVMRRTNGVWGAGGRLNLPWPRSLGTPPWGAKHELEHGAARRGLTYAVDLLRPDAVGALRQDFDTLVDVVADGAPGLLYIGNARLPRHVVLILPGDGDRMLDVYDPGSGRVDHFRRDAMVERRLGLSGWDIPWFAVRPDGVRTVRAKAYEESLDPTPA